MIYNVILSRENSQYFARVREWPEVTAEEPTRDEALDRIKNRLKDYLTRQVEIVQIEVPVQFKDKNPWLDTFGMFRDDPTFDDFRRELTDCGKNETIPVSE